MSKIFLIPICFIIGVFLAIFCLLYIKYLVKDI